MKKKTFLVTGGTGFIGSNICKLLIKKNFDVKIFDNNSRGSIVKIRDIKTKLRFINGDIRNYNKLNISLKGVDAVIHLAYVNGTKFFYKKPYEILDIAVNGLINILDFCKKKKSKKLLFSF